MVGTLEAVAKLIDGPAADEQNIQAASVPSPSSLTNDPFAESLLLSTFCPLYIIPAAARLGAYFNGADFASKDMYAPEPEKSFSELVNLSSKVGSSW